VEPEKSNFDQAQSMHMCFVVLTTLQKLLLYVTSFLPSENSISCFCQLFTV